MSKNSSFPVMLLACATCLFTSCASPAARVERALRTADSPEDRAKAWLYAARSSESIPGEAPDAARIWRLDRALGQAMAMEDSARRAKVVSACETELWETLSDLLDAEAVALASLKESAERAELPATGARRPPFREILDTIDLLATLWEVNGVASARESALAAGGIRDIGVPRSARSIKEPIIWAIVARLRGGPRGWIGQPDPNEELNPGTREAWTRHFAAGGRFPNAVPVLLGSWDGVNPEPFLATAVLADETPFRGSALRMLVQAWVRAGRPEATARGLIQAWRAGEAPAGVLITLWGINRDPAGNGALLTSEEASDLAAAMVARLPLGHELVARELLGQLPPETALQWVNRSCGSDEVVRWNREVLESLAAAWSRSGSLDELGTQFLSKPAELKYRERSLLLAACRPNYGPPLIGTSRQLEILRALRGTESDAKERHSQTTLLAEILAGMGRSDELLALARELWTSAALTEPGDGELASIDPIDIGLGNGAGAPGKYWDRLSAENVLLKLASLNQPQQPVPLTATDPVLASVSLLQTTRPDSTHSDAEALFSKYLGHFPGSSWAHRRRIEFEVQYFAGQRDADALARRVADLLPTMPHDLAADFLRTAARAMSELQRTEEAADWLTKSIELGPSVSEQDLSGLIDLALKLEGAGCGRAKLDAIGQALSSPAFSSKMTLRLWGRLERLKRANNANT